MYLVFGFCEDIASNIAVATEPGGNPFGTLYRYFLYISENLDLFAIRLSIFGFDIVLILVSTSQGLTVTTLMFVFHSSILKASVIASTAYFVAE